MSKTIYFIANWKMNGNFHSITEIENVNNFLRKNVFSKLKKIIFCPPSNLLVSFTKKIKAKLIDFGAQDISKIDFSHGPYTGQLSAKMIKDSGANYVIIGHSEKRLLDEDYKTIKKKISIAIKNKLKVIFCIGENLSQKNKNLSFKTLKNQITNSLDKKIDFNNLIIAYEPIWSIGTGIIPSNNYLDQIYQNLKKFLNEKYKVKYPVLIYGGSVTTDNVAILAKNSLISGFLIGGDSLRSKSLIKIIKNYFK